MRRCRLRVAAIFLAVALISGRRPERCASSISSPMPARSSCWRSGSTSSSALRGCSTSGTRRSSRSARTRSRCSRVPQFGIHVPFWVMLFVASGVAAIFGILLGAPTLRLRGDYLAIVTLGFGEIVPQTFLNLSQWTGGPNGIGSLDQPAIFGLPLRLQSGAVLLPDPGARSRSRFGSPTICERAGSGRAWMAIREDELAAAHMGINTTTAKLAAFALGASFSGLAGVRVRLEAAARLARSVRLQRQRRRPLDAGAGRDGQHPRRRSWAASSSRRSTASSCRSSRTSCTASDVNWDLTNARFLIYGVILVGMMLLRPEGLLPSRQRAAELHADQSDPGTAAQEQELYERAI